MAEVLPDQAEGLRRLLSGDFVRIITLTSGRRGAGKTAALINLAAALTRRGKQVMLLDEHQGRHGVVEQMGLTPRYDLTHVLRREQRLEQVMLKGSEGILVVSAGKCVQELAQSPAAAQESLVEAFSRLAQPVDVLLVDAEAGVASHVLPPSLAAQELVVVVDPHPASMTESYALIKVLNQGYARRSFHILVNRANSQEEAMTIFNNLADAAHRFLRVTLDFMGSVPLDPKLQRAAQLGRAVVEAFPASESAQSFHALAEEIDQWPSPDEGDGQIRRFMQRLVQSSKAAAVDAVRQGRA